MPFVGGSKQIEPLLLMALERALQENPDGRLADMDLQRFIDSADFTAEEIDPMLESLLTGENDSDVDVFEDQDGEFAVRGTHYDADDNIHNRYPAAGFATEDEAWDWINKQSNAFANRIKKSKRGKVNTEALRHRVLRGKKVKE